MFSTEKDDNNLIVLTYTSENKLYIKSISLMKIFCSNINIDVNILEEKCLKKQTSLWYDCYVFENEELAEKTIKELNAKLIYKKLK